LTKGPANACRWMSAALAEGVYQYDGFRWEYSDPRSRELGVAGIAFIGRDGSIKKIDEKEARIHVLGKKMAALQS
jgi:hypothetical protein